ncbi:cysteine--tRNA ligase [Candidatus Shapirobacteria bacterium CG09_land_8_20_14_0_10_49_15]|uniref:Cysteine--tRNA ligase n=2 Tax=Candidatus Shapironibacteriota TaxID=1752721 RepID=A0A2M8L7V0_9BACT|nr:MAG: cysteine--tRNA ligase [Candidatus Shapirobacteria bacterium CG09_land_8_20_14_0_10_49_15]PJE70326.1 MAG: cysteine--tRNA ligase [Candidatus Shapirobacteria bacterium CG10_big_fil_rev_8_21_14_0_10_48_15]
MIKFYNTLTHRIEEFKPIKPGWVGMYTCGPTVYGPGHLGHARSYINFDLLKRVLISNGLQVTHVLNITDVHDDMIRRANELGVSLEALAAKYIPLFQRDLHSLNILPADHYPRVTENIPEIIQVVKTLVDKGYAYVEKDGSVYFKVRRFKNYGQLSGIKLAEAKAGTRAVTDKYEKKQALDFALWKATKKDEPAWPSPWGQGRPGWHIECSVMSQKFLGQTIDIHAGAMDLKFPHHENEIAQSEAATGVKFVNFWFHGGLLTVDGQKMSKSLGNFIEMRQLVKKGFAPLAMRYLCLTAHYRSKLNFTWPSLQAAQTALRRLQSVVADLKTTNRQVLSPEKLAKADAYQKRFTALINDDLKIPEALALVWEIVKSNLPGYDKHDLLVDFDQVLGLRLTAQTKVQQKVPPAAMKLVAAREKLRQQQKWAAADKLRQQIESLGWQVKDTAAGVKLTPS